MSRILISLLVGFFVFAYVNASHHHHEPKCPAHESFNLCGRVKEPTCSNPKPEVCKKEDCNKKIEGCRCDIGYVRDEAKNCCIKVNDCPKPPPKCPAHESFNLCGRVKEPTCSNPKPGICKKEDCNKHTQGCRCDKGYVRDEAKNCCVLEKDCVKCGHNEKFGPCGRSCEGNCKNIGPVRCAALICKKSGCQCKEGFYRNDETDKCVPATQCPKKCGYGEIYAPCGRQCEGCCKSPTLPEICHRIKCSNKECRCDLDNGFVRDEKTKKCVHKDKCPC